MDLELVNAQARVRVVRHGVRDLERGVWCRFAVSGRQLPVTSNDMNCVREKDETRRVPAPLPQHRLQATPAYHAAMLPIWWSVTTG